MAERTKIQWCDSTVNPTGGCNGCELEHGDVKKCYAARMVERFGRTNPGLPSVFTEPETFPGRMTEATAWPDLTGQARCNKPWLDNLPRLIFVSDMSDALCDEFSFEYLQSEVVGAVTSELGQRHYWAWLTKRPQRMADFSAWLGQRGIARPANLWAGTTITTQAVASRIDSLLQVDGADTVHFVSVEPAWEQMDLRPWLSRLDWVIHGGESGRGAEAFDILWAENLLAQCRSSTVPYFLKQLGSHPVRNGSPAQLQNFKGGDWSEWPEHLRVREMPAITFQPHEGGNAE
jgi:protein gp37